MSESRIYSFNNMDLRGRKDLQKLDLRGACFADANLSGLSWSGKDFSNTDFSNCVLDNSTFTNCIFNDAVLKNALISNAKIDKSAFYNADFRSAHISNSVINGSDLSRALMKHAIIQESQFVDTCMATVVLDLALIIKCEFSKCTMCDASLLRTNTMKSKFLDVTLTNSVIKGARFEDTTFEDAIFKDATIHGVKLINTRLQGDFCDATITETTGGKFITIAGTGSSRRSTVYDIENDKVSCGCFGGTLDEFVTRIKKTYPSETDRFRQEYMVVATTLRALRDINSMHNWERQAVSADSQDELVYKCIKCGITHTEIKGTPLGNDMPMYGCVKKITDEGDVT